MLIFVCDSFHTIVNWLKLYYYFSFLEIDWEGIFEKNYAYRNKFMFMVFVLSLICFLSLSFSDFIASTVIINIVYMALLQEPWSVTLWHRTQYILVWRKGSRWRDGKENITYTMHQRINWYIMLNKGGLIVGHNYREMKMKCEDWSMWY